MVLKKRKASEAQSSSESDTDTESIEAKIAAVSSALTSLKAELDANKKANKKAKKIKQQVATKGEDAARQAAKKAKTLTKTQQVRNSKVQVGAEDYKDSWTFNLIRSFLIIVIFLALHTSWTTYIFKPYIQGMSSTSEEDHKRDILSKMCPNGQCEYNLDNMKTMQMPPQH
jgi:hypothetical protein